MEDNPFASFSFQTSVPNQHHSTERSSKFFVDECASDAENEQSFESISDNPSVESDTMYKHEKIQDVRNNDFSEDEKVQEKPKQAIIEDVHAREKKTIQTSKNNSNDPLWYLSFQLPKGHSDPIIKEFAFISPPDP